MAKTNYSKLLHLFKAIEEHYPVGSRLCMTQMKYDLKKHASLRLLGYRDKAALTDLFEYAYRGFLIVNNEDFVTKGAWDIYEKQKDHVISGVKKLSDRDRETYGLLKESELIYIESVDTFITKHRQKCKQSEGREPQQVQKPCVGVSSKTNICAPEGGWDSLKTEAERHAYFVDNARVIQE